MRPATLSGRESRTEQQGNAVAVAPDGSVYAAGTTPRSDQIGNFDIVVLKITAAGSLVWQRTYSAGEVVDPRGRMAAGPDGSIVMVGAIQTVSRRTADIAALIVKLTSDGALVFDKQFNGRVDRDRGGSRNRSGQHDLCSRDDYHLRYWQPGRLRAPPATDGQEITGCLNVGRNRLRDRRRCRCERSDTHARGDDNDGATVLVARCFREIIGAEEALLRSSRARSPMSLALRRLLLQAPQRRVEARRSAETSRRRS